MYPFNLNICNEVNLYKLDDGRYQPIKRGPIEPIMIGHKYVLVKEDIAEYFRSLDIERVTYEPAIIWDRSTDTEHKDFVRLLINRHFDTGQIDDIDISGKQFLLMDNNYVFVTPQLKSELEQSEYGFKFSEGMTNFG